MMSQEEDRILQEHGKILQEQVERSDAVARELKASDERVKQYAVELQRVTLGLRKEKEIKKRLSEENKDIERVVNLEREALNKLYAK